MKCFSTNLVQLFPRDMRSAATSVCFYILVVGGTLIVTPRNRAVMSGQKVEMQCQTDNFRNYATHLKWYSQRPGYPKEYKVTIYNGYALPSHAARFYTITTSHDGKYTLGFNASEETAQRYICLEPGTLTTKSAELVVLESDPRCYVIRDDGFVNITCTIVFRGNWAPEMEWTWCNNETVIISDVSNSISPNGQISSTLTVRRKDNNNRSCYRVTTMFREVGRPPETSADNIPSYNYTICFKFPDWNNTSECNETREEDSNAYNTPSNSSSLDDNPLTGRSLIVIVGTGAALGGIAVTVVGVILCRLAQGRCNLQPKKKEYADRRGSPHDYESVNSGDMDSIQHIPDIEMNQTPSNANQTSFQLYFGGDLPNDYESVNSGDMDSIQHAPEIEMDQSSTNANETVDQSMTEAETLNHYDTLDGCQAMQEPGLYINLEEPNPEEQIDHERETMEKPNDYLTLI